MIQLITAVGSRQTPENILVEMKKIGEWCRQHNVTIRSGHSEGADWAFEQGCGGRTEVYIPWKNFNSHLKSVTYAHILDDNRAEVISKKYHPTYNKLSVGAKKLIDRNAYQVLGASLHDPSKLLVCWTPNAQIVGGTGQTMRIALAYNIPILNMALDQYDTADKVTTAIAGL